jgi:hypothetical protein
MAAKTWYYTNVRTGNWNTLDETPVTAANTADGWLIGTVGDSFNSAYWRGVLRGSATFNDTIEPNGVLDTVNNDAFRTTNPYTGTFLAGNWTFIFAMKCTITRNQGGAIIFRVHRAAGVDGAGAVEITSGQQQASTTAIMNSTTTDYPSQLVLSLPAVTLNREYLFVELAWKRIRVPSAGTGDILFRTGSSASLGTRVVSPEYVDGPVGGPYLFCEA